MLALISARLSSGYLSIANSHGLLLEPGVLGLCAIGIAQKLRSRSSRTECEHLLVGGSRSALLLIIVFLAPSFRSEVA